VSEVRVERPERATGRILVHIRCTAVTYRLAGEAELRAADVPREGRG
jgi:hypothetical protein